MVVPRLVEASAADLVSVERFRAVLHQGIRSHVVVGADNERA
jgi:hypothetical protein